MGKMMKKTLLTVLSLLLAVNMLVGCGKKSGGDTEGASVTVTLSASAVTL